MHEKLRQFEQESKLEIYGLGAKRIPWEAALEKYAELIVRECAKFLDENSGYDNSNNAWHPEPEDLLKHFGVEE